MNVLFVILIIVLSALLAIQIAAFAFAELLPVRKLLGADLLFTPAAALGEVLATVRERAEHLSARPLPEIGLLGLRSLHGANAFVVGRKTPTIVVTSAATAHLSEFTLSAIFAHELGHVALGHLRTAAIFACLRIALGIALFVAASFSGSALVAAIAIVVVLAFRSNHDREEIEADEFAAQVVGRGAVISALRTIGAPQSRIGALLMGA